jgi:DNA-binding GntR family transcriptional regulator
VPETPAYLRIAGDLRTAILGGELLPGSRLPSETKLMAQYGVSRTVVKWALSVLKGDGLVEGRRGSGTFVRSTPRIVRHSHGRGQRTRIGPTSPFARDAEEAGQQSTWVARMDAIGVRIDDSVERITARPAIEVEARELKLPLRGQFVFVIERTYYAAGRPVETADITIPGDRYELVYRIPID